MLVKLAPPIGDKNWSLHFTEIPYNTGYPDNDIIHNEEKANIWYWCRYYGNFFHVNPFLQGNSNDWMMIEFWSNDQVNILEACIQISEILNLELNF